jgi:hypothetical protein
MGYPALAADLFKAPLVTGMFGKHIVHIIAVPGAVRVNGFFEKIEWAVKFIQWDFMILQNIYDCVCKPVGMAWAAG